MIYSSDKLVQFPGFINKVRHGGHPAPIHIHMIISDLCNQACSFCSYRMPGYQSSFMFYEINSSKGGLRRDFEHPDRNYNPNRMIPHDKAIEIISDCADMGVKAIQFTGGGEPTAHPRHEDIFRYALEKDMKCALVSNAINWSNTLIKDILPHFIWVRVSVDSSNPDMYSKVRNVPKSHWNTMMKNCCEFSKYKSDCVFGIGFVITQENWKEIDSAVCMAKSMGANNIRIGVCFSTLGSGYYDGIEESITESVNNVTKHNSENFKIFPRWPEKMDDLLQGSPEHSYCMMMRTTPYIGGDQNVYTCCNNAYNPLGLIGSLKKQSFKELWDKDARNFFTSFDARNCGHCQFHDKNKIGLQLLNDGITVSDNPMPHDFFV